MLTGGTLPPRHMGLVTQLREPALYRRARRAVSSPFLRALIIFTLGVVAASNAGAAQVDPIGPFAGKTISSIDVIGLKRIEKDAVLAKLTSKVGGTISPQTVRSDIQAVYGMGFFDDIEIRALPSPQNPKTAAKLVVVVKERPVISK